MRNGLGFKKRYLVASLLLICVVYGIWQVMTFSPFEESILYKKKVNAFTLLYVTEGSAGATTKNVYQFYLIPSRTPEKDFLKGAGHKYASLLSTSDENAEAEIINSVIRLSVKGVIYHFTNAASYSTTIYLTSSP